MNLTLQARIDRFSRVIGCVEVTNQHKIICDVEVQQQKIHQYLTDLRKNQKNLYVIGNGGSASVAAHAVTDFFNVAKLRASTLHESSLLTCMANDFGYENAFGRILEQLINQGDMVIAISSSGKSMNMRNAAAIALEKGAYVITLTGFSPNNPLRQLGDSNFWLNSDDYGFVEVGHQFILHNIADRFNEKLIS